MKKWAVGFASWTLLALTTPAEATPITFLPPSGGEVLAWAPFTTPDDGRYQYVHLYWEGGAPAEISIRSSYTWRKEYWLDGVGLWGSETDIPVECHTWLGCLNIVRPGYAVARFEAPRGRVFSDPCTAQSPNPCRVWYTPLEGALWATFVLEGSGPMTGRIELGKAGAIPEPTTWSIMIVGFGVVGAALRRTRPWRRIRV